MGTIKSTKIFVTVILQPNETKTIDVSKFIPVDNGLVGSKSVTITSCCSETPVTYNYNILQAD